MERRKFVDVENVIHIASDWRINNKKSLQWNLGFVHFSWRGLYWNV